MRGVVSRGNDCDPRGAGELLPTHGSFLCLSETVGPVVVAASGVRGVLGLETHGERGYRGYHLPDGVQREHKKHKEGSGHHEQDADIHHLCPPLFRVGLHPPSY